MATIISHRLNHYIDICQYAWLHIEIFNLTKSVYWQGLERKNSLFIKRKSVRYDIKTLNSFQQGNIERKPCQLMGYGKAGCTSTNNTDISFDGVPSGEGPGVDEGHITSIVPGGLGVEKNKQLVPQCLPQTWSNSAGVNYYCGAG